MGSVRDNRQRAAARARLEREMAARLEAARRKRLLQARIGGGVAILVVLAAIIWVAIATIGGGSHPAASSPSGCVWTPAPIAPIEPPASPVSEPAASGSPAASASASPAAPGLPPTDVPKAGYQVITFNTNLGVVKVEMNLTKTPCTAASMAHLVQAKFFDNAGAAGVGSCHRLAASINALQCGDPTGTGTGGPGYQFADENLPGSQLPAYHTGDLAMANSGANTNGSQFFFIWSTTTGLAGNYTLWGHVLQGLDIITKVGKGGDDGAFEPDPGGGHPTIKLIFKSVTVGPVTATSEITPTSAPPASPAGSAAPTTTPAS